MGWSRTSYAWGSRAARKDLRRGWRLSKWRNFRGSWRREERRNQKSAALESGGETNVASLRSKGREFAMQMLFQWDMSQQDPTKLEAKFLKGAKAAETTLAVPTRFVEGTSTEILALHHLL